MPHDLEVGLLINFGAVSVLEADLVNHAAFRQLGVRRVIT